MTSLLVEIIAEMHRNDKNIKKCIIPNRSKQQNITKHWRHLVLPLELGPCSVAMAKINSDFYTILGINKDTRDHQGPYRRKSASFTVSAKCDNDCGICSV